MYNFLHKFFTFKKTTNKKDNLRTIIYGSDQDYLASAENIYKNNVIVHRCINLISHAVSHLPINIFNNHKYHYLNKILQHPNLYQSNFDLLREIVANLLVFGNSYVLFLCNKRKQIIEIYSLHPNKVEIIIKNNIHMGYTYNKEKRYYIDQRTGKCSVLHLKNYNPNEDSVYGKSPIIAAKSAILLHNKTSDWNYALLKQGARPSGILFVKNENTYLTQEQFERIKEQFADSHTNSINAGKPLLLDSGLDWKDISIKPKDMDFIESKNMAAREIALAFGVPPQLLGIQGDNTYSNMQESRLSLWEETIIPLLDKVESGLTRILSLLTEENLIVRFNREKISILSEKRFDNLQKISKIDFLSDPEKKKLAGIDN